MAGLKTFAQEARRNLMQSVLQRIEKWGFDDKGNVLEEVEKVSGGYVFRGQVYDDQTVFAKWQALKSAIVKKGIETIVEEGAYTWFNRMMAIRILSKNGYIPKQLEYVSTEAKIPQILANARRGQYSFLSVDEQTRLAAMLTDYEKDNEAFSILLTGYCRAHNTLNRVFGKLDDYTELLLPDNMLQEGGFLHMLNSTDAISDEEYQKVELIGWLYQFYISERKDEVFASFKKNKKAEAKDIPAATQIFTPNWIVKYMVENTAGKIWLDKHPDSPLKENMKYLVESTSPSGEESRELGTEGLINEVEDLTLMDPACGSGHILVEGFDLIYQMYMEEFVTPEEAVQSIFEKNLFGLDIDDRAAQLATFAILLKAAKVYPDIWTKDWLPQVYAMPEAKDFSRQEVEDFLGEEGQIYADQLYDALLLMKQAKNLGSVMKIELSKKAQSFIEERFDQLKGSNHLSLNEQLVLGKIEAYIFVLLLLTKKYTSVVANPPYMGQKSMNADLKNYVNVNYPITKSDLCTVFIEVLPKFTSASGSYGFIVPPSWLFLSSFEKLRNQIVQQQKIDSLLHLSRGVFGADFGSVATVISNQRPNESSKGTYLRLVERTFQEFYQSHLEELFLLANRDENFRYKFIDYSKDDPKLVHSDEGLKIYYPNIPQNNFSKIPGSPIAYWVSERIVYAFDNNVSIKDLGKGVKGLDTGMDAYFLKNWWEPSVNKTNIENQESAKWQPYHKGGAFRKWYGNKDFLINWYNGGEEVKSFKGAYARNQDLYYKEGIEWSRISSSKIGLRLMSNSIFGGGSQAAFLNNSEHNKYILGLLNSKFAYEILKILNPTLVYQGGDINRIPVIIQDLYYELVKELVEELITCSKIDWDTKEYSWDFEQSPLINGNTDLESAYAQWAQNVKEDFFNLHENEEELNRIFIDIYSLQEELTPEVALKDITILQDELDRSALEALEPTFRAEGKNAIELPIDRAEVMRQFISYTVGLMLGRYRLDKPGLNIAHLDPSEEETSNYTYNGRNVVIDEDAIIPLMGQAATFKDDAYYQLQELLHTIWGANTLTDNINFIEECLDKDLEKYLVKDFWKDHCKRYKKKPIYWLFSSPKGAFQVLVYMHRMNRFTLEKIRSEYLLPHMKYLRGQIEQLETSGANPKLEEKLSLQLMECQEYDLLLKDKADQQIEFDLDDGVTENIKLFEGVVAKVK